MEKLIDQANMILKGNTLGKLRQCPTVAELSFTDLSYLSGYALDYGVK